MVLELARDGAVDRPVAGVVHAWRELVREQPAVRPRRARARSRRRSRARRAASTRAPPPRPGEREAAGARETRRIPSRCTFSASGQKRVSPSRPRTATIESSRSKATISSASSSSPSSSSGIEPALPLAVISEPARLDESRQPRCLRESRSAPSGSRGAGRAASRPGGPARARARAAAAGRRPHAPPRRGRSRTRT